MPNTRQIAGRRQSRIGASAKYAPALLRKAYRPRPFIEGTEAQWNYYLAVRSRQRIVLESAAICFGTLYFTSPL